MINGTIDFKKEKSNPILELTEVKPSPIEGLGLFSKEFIPKNTIWWSAEPSNILLLTKNQYRALFNSVHSNLAKSFYNAILIYSYYVKHYDALVLCLDNARYVNHSFKPNSGAAPDAHPLCAITLQDIHPGEEILEDYTKYDKCPWASLYEGFLSQEFKKINKTQFK